MIWLSLSDILGIVLISMSLGALGVLIIVAKQSKKWPSTWS